MADRRLIAPRLAAAGAIVLALALEGCSAGQCDPHQADLISGIGCAVGPGYADRNAKDQAALGSAREQLNSAKDQAAAANAQAAQASAQLASTQAQLHALDVKRHDLASRIAQARQHQGVDQEKLNQVQTQLDQLQRDRAALPSQPDPGQVQEQQQKLNQLYDIVKQM